MFEVLAWLHRYLFIFMLLAFSLLCAFIYFYNKKIIQPFLPVIIIITAISSFGLLSIAEENTNYAPIYIGLIFCFQYLLVRINLIKILKIPDILLFDIVNMLLTIGLIWLYRLEPEYAIRQCGFSVLGNCTFFLIFYVLKKIDLTKNYSLHLAMIIFITLITTQLFGIEVNGSKNWIELFGYRFQPSEFLKILFVIYISSILSKGLDKNVLINSSISMHLVVSFFALQKDLGSALIFFMVYLILLFIMDNKIYPTIISSVSALIMAVLSYYTFGHIKSRVEAWLNPWKYLSGKSYQVTQSLFAIASGGLLGSGLNLGYPKFIPASHTDFIYSAICEEAGIISGIIIIFMLCIVTLIGFDYSRNCKTDFNKLICLGLSSLTGIQTLIIVSGVLNIIPITGITLPFISYGGSSLISQTINICLLYFISMKETGEERE